MSLQESVEQFKKMFPDKYVRAQQIGESYMNLKYELKSGVDEEGESMKVKELINLLESNTLLKEDLYEEDLKLLEKYNYKID